MGKYLLLDITDGKRVTYGPYRSARSAEKARRKLVRSSHPKPIITRIHGPIYKVGTTYGGPK